MREAVETSVAQPPPAVTRTAITAEGGGAASSSSSLRVACAEAAGAVRTPALASPLAALVTGHVLHDGEVILLILKPSRWFVLLTTLRWAAVIGILLAAAKIYDEQLPGQNAVYVEAGVFVLAGRVMWAVLQWIGRLYVLTDLRILKLSGVFAVDIFGCPLRKVARTRILYTVRERLFGLGSIEIVPSDEEYPIDQWQMVAKPVEVHRQIVDTINRAKQGCAR